MNRRNALTAALLTSAVCGWAQQASAATVSYEEFTQPGYHMAVVVTETLRYQAAPDETNVLTLSTSPNTASPGLGADLVLLHDTGAPITAPAQCATVDIHTVSCPAGNVPAPDAAGAPTGPVAHILLGDGNDSATVLGDAPTILEGGPGDDHLSGGSGNDLIIGGPGNDTLVGGGGSDKFLVDGIPGESDAITAGPGTSTLQYNGSLPFSADLSAGTAGVPGEHDTITGIRNVTGGSGPNTLTGDVNANVLRGNSAADVLDGRGGGDTFDLSLTRSFIDFDGFQTDVGIPDSAPDRVQCSSPTDRVIAPGPGDLLKSCTTAGGAGDIAALGTASARLKGTRATFQVIAVDRRDGSLAAPSLRLEARIGGRRQTIGAAHVHARGRLSVRLSRAAIRALGHGAIGVTVTVRRVDRYDNGTGSVALPRSISFRTRIHR